jgi:DNA-binding NtrC family response regulator
VHRILVVEDDKLIRWSLKEIFTQEGYEVDAVDTIKDALSRATNNAYNLIFADIEMGEETGIDMLQEIDELQPLTKIVILSANTRNQIEPFLGTLKIFSIVEKPFNAEQIKMIAKEALGS